MNKAVPFVKPLSMLNMYAWAVALCWTVTACGGGGGSSTPTQMQTQTQTSKPTPSGSPAATPVPTAAECAFGDYKAAIVAEINTIRSKSQVCGGVAYPAVGALAWNGQLESAAATHSTDMVMNNYFAHPGTDGSKVGERSSAAGYRYQRVGENIAGGQSSASQVSAEWLASASHCSNMMTASFVDIGVSCKTSASSTYQYYWTLVMGNH